MHWFESGRHVAETRLLAILLILTLLTALGPLQSSIAQAPTPPATQPSGPKTLAYDQPSQGLITDQTPEDSWTLTAPGKDLIAISVERTAGTLVPEVELRDDKAKHLAQLAHDATGASAHLTAVQLPSAGSYTLVVGRYNGKRGKTSGQYSLKVSLLGAGADRSDLNLSYPVEFLVGRTYPGQLSNEKWVVIYEFGVPAKDHVLVTVRRTQGTLMPSVAVLDDAGALLGQADTTPDGTNAQVDVTLPQPGPYRIKVSRHDGQAGATTGSYTVTTSLLGRGPDAEGLSIIDGPITFNVPRSGTLINAKWQDTWMIHADNAVTVTLAVQRVDGTLIPNLDLLDSHRNALASAKADDTFAAAAIQNFQLPGSGDYLVVVSRADGSAGATTGSYQLVVLSNP